MLKRVGFSWIPLSSFALAVLLAVLTGPSSKGHAARTPRAITQAKANCTATIDKKGLVWEFDATAKTLKLKASADYDTTNPPYDAFLTVIVSGKFKDNATGKTVRHPILDNTVSRFGLVKKETLSTEAEIDQPTMMAFIQAAETKFNAKFADEIDKLTLSVIATCTDSSGTHVDTEKKETPSKKK